MVKNKTFRIERYNFEGYNLFLLYRRNKFIYHQRKKKKEYSLQEIKEKEHSNPKKEWSDLSGLLRKFYQFKNSTIKRDVIYFILYQINLFLHLFRA